MNSTNQPSAAPIPTIKPIVARIGNAYQGRSEGGVEVFSSFDPIQVKTILIPLRS